MNDEPDRARPAARPCLWLGLALAAGCELGFALGGRPSLALGAAAIAAVAWLALAPRLAAPGWAALFLVLAAHRCARLGTAEIAAAPVEDATAPALGTWRPIGDQRGWIQGLAAPARPSPADAAYFELGGAAPRAGELVLLPLGHDAAPFARGPWPSSGGLSARFHGRARLAPDEWTRVAPPPGASAPAARHIEAWSEDLRAALAARVRPVARALPPGLARSLLFGDTQSFDPELRDLFARTGTLHLLAVSGQHLTLLALCLLGPLTALVARALAALGLRAAWVELAVLALRVGAIAIYAPLTGAKAPVKRAAVALTLALAAPFVPAHARTPGSPPIGRAPDALSLWGLALALECLLAPAELDRLSVRLSFLATLGLALGCGPMARALHAALERAWPPPIVPPRTALGACAQALVRRGARASCTALAGSAAAVLATLPSIWVAIGEWSPLGAIATVLALPLFAALLFGLWLAVAVPIPAIGPTLAWLADALVLVLRRFDDLPGTPLPLPPRPALLLALATALAFVGVRALLSYRSERDALGRHTDQPVDRRPHGRAGVGLACARAALALWAVLLLPWTLAPRALEVWALDAGDASCVVLRAPGTAPIVLGTIGRGRPRLMQEALMPLLRAWDTSDVELALADGGTGDEDGLEWLARRFSVRWRVRADAARPGVEHRIDLAPSHEGWSELAIAPASTAELTLGQGGRPIELWTLRSGRGDGGKDVATAIAWRGRLVARVRADQIADLAHALPADMRELDVLVIDGPGRDGAATLLGGLRPREVWLATEGPSALERHAWPPGVRLRTTWRDGPIGTALDPVPDRGRGGAALDPVPAEAAAEPRRL